MGVCMAPAVSAPRKRVSKILGYIFTVLLAVGPVQSSKRASQGFKFLSVEPPLPSVHRRVKRDPDGFEYSGQAPTVEWRVEVPVAVAELRTVPCYDYYAARVFINFEWLPRVRAGSTSTPLKRATKVSASTSPLIQLPPLIAFLVQSACCSG